MKPSTLIFLASLCTPTTIFAQALSKDATAKAPKLIIGASLGLAESHYYYHQISELGPATGLFARYYFGNHLALESGVKFSAHGPLTISSTSFSGIRRITTKSVSIPIHLQYHILSPKSKVRPYFGLGIGMTRKYYNTTYAYNNGAINESNTAFNDLFIQFTQGVTWQITKDLQLNQAVYYQRNRIGNLGIDFGVGYTIR